MHIKTRTAIRWISFCAALCLLFGGFALSARNETAARGERQDTRTAAAYRQTVTELAEALQKMDYALQKGRYASTDVQTVTWAAQVWREAGAAGSCLEQLPVYELQLNHTRRFLNQVGEYTLWLAKKQLNGTALTEEEEQSLTELAAAAQELAARITRLSGRITDDNMDMEGFEALFAPSEEGSDPTELEQFEDIFEGMPPLDYDGLNSGSGSDWIGSWVTTLEAKSDEELRQQAAEFLDVDPDRLTRTESDAPLALRTFEDGERSVTLTASGFLWQLNRGREPGDVTIRDEAAIRRGADFLAENGFGIVEDIQVRTGGNQLTVTYVALRSDVLCYPERITVDIALDNGEILRVDAAEFLKNYDPSKDLTPEISEGMARSVLKENLTVTESRLALLPGNDGRSTLCHQFRVNDDGDDTAVLIFINAQTGAEEEILIVIESEGNRLTV